MALEEVEVEVEEGLQPRVMAEEGVLHSRVKEAEEEL